MALTIRDHLDTGGEPGNYYEVTERLYINADRTKIVPEDSPEAAFVFSTPGKKIPMAEAERLGLAKKKQAKPAANKQRKTAAKNK